ncbi:MAG: TetR/AcrR family transcriptional regulator [Novosphingobium sp.]
MRKPAAFRRVEPDARRQSLIDACLTVLARDGAGKASVRVIAAEAGVSPGLVGHYFPAVDDLVAAAYAAVGARVDAALDAALAQAGDQPLARVKALVSASFEAPLADPELLATWIAFWSLVRSREDIGQQHRQQYAAFRGRLEQELAACGVPAARCPALAITLTALVDGLWLELCLSPDVLTGTEAAAMACDATERLVGAAERKSKP